MSELVRDVVVVGGGSAGWLTAVHLRWALGEQSSVTLIESPNIPTIGVGEGTQPDLRALLPRLGIDVEECMKATGASYKNGIRFVGWNTPDQSDHYFHPFISYPAGSREQSVDAMLCWDRLRAEGQELPPLPEACWCETALIKGKRAPVGVRNGERLPHPLGNFALHLDAARLALYLHDIGAERGIRHIIDDVTDVSLDDRGHITAVNTRGHGPISGQFFIDCTGFARKLIRAVDPDYEFIDFGEHLLNNRAITARIDWAEGAPLGIESCTVSTALSAGWVWEVPLYERAGTGYVYSSPFISDDDAEHEFLGFLRSKGFQPEATGRLKFETGRVRRPWVGNCVTVGLSAGFIEPLEATGISLSNYQVYRLLELWPTTDFEPGLSERFNAVMQRSYEWTRDFIVLHFCLSKRRDSDYWRHVTSDEAVPDSVRDLLELHDQRWPFGAIVGGEPGYRLSVESVACILSGFGRYPQSRSPYIAALPRERVSERLAEARQKEKDTMRVAVGHDRWLMFLNGHPDAKPIVRSSAPRPAFESPSIFDPGFPGLDRSSA